MKKKKKCSCDIYSDYTLPPCAKLLGSVNPLIKDGKVIYKNNNRLYFFLTFHTNPKENETYDALNPATYTFSSNGNMQISPYIFFIGMYINEVQKGNVKDFKEKKIHDDTNADSFIKEVLSNEYEINQTCIPSISYVISNSSAVMPVFYGNIKISPINYYILLVLSRLYGDYGILFSDNAYITPDFINYELATMYVEFDNEDC